MEIVVYKLDVSGEFFSAEVAKKWYPSYVDMSDGENSKEVGLRPASDFTDEELDEMIGSGYFEPLTPYRIDRERTIQLNDHCLIENGDYAQIGFVECDADLEHYKKLGTAFYCDYVEFDDSVLKEYLKNKS